MDPFGSRFGGLGSSGGAEAWYYNIPPVTRAALTLTFIFSLLYTIGFIPGNLLLLDWNLVFTRLHIWRLFTHVFFIGKFSFGWIIFIYMWSQVSSELEQNAVFSHSTKGAYLYFITLMTLFVGIISGIIYWPTGLYAHSDALLFSVVYYWSRRETYTPVSIYFLTVQGYQLPFALLFLHLLMGNSIVLDLIGLASGHIYYFLKEVLPAQGGPSLLATTPKCFDWAAEMVSNNSPLFQSSSPTYYQPTRSTQNRSESNINNLNTNNNNNNNNNANNNTFGLNNRIHRTSSNTTQPFSGRGYQLGGQ